MNLFNQDRINNILPKDGTVHYYPNVLTHDDANRYAAAIAQFRSNYNS
jgi:hypothetical protein